MYIRNTMLLLMASLLFSGCVPNAPYRTANLTCNSPGSDSDVCNTAVHEHGPNYDLLFSEFDDQGLPYPTASGQTDWVLADLNRISQKHHNRVAIYVFVTGWKNNAAEDDGNVTNFRKMLAAADEDEQAANRRAGRNEGDGRHVVGIFIGWRGLATNLEPFNELSFWTRKAAAGRVATGSVRALFAQLKLFQCKNNRNTTCSLTEAKMNPDKNVRLILIGHSFGGLILYNAVSEALMESVIWDKSDPSSPPPVPRFGDMVVLLNPAFEASQYEPLAQLLDRQYPGFSPPIFVSVTSTADWATGDAFPLGRKLNAVLELKANSDEDERITHTMGHIESLITHRLTLSTESCPTWKALAGLKDNALEQQIKINREAEELAHKEWFATHHPPLEAHWTRPFCGGGLLEHISGQPNSPVWNIQTDGDLVPSHTAIMEDRFVAVMRQLAADTLFSDSTQESSAAREQAGPGLSLATPSKTTGDAAP